MARWFRWGLSVTGPFGCRCLTSLTMLRFHFPLIEPCVRISRTRLSDWLRSPAHEVSLHFGRDSENFTSSLASKVLSVTA